MDETARLEVDGKSYELLPECTFIDGLSFNGDSTLKDPVRRNAARDELDPVRIGPRLEFAQRYELSPLDFWGNKPVSI